MGPGGFSELSRCLSTASSMSHGSATTDASYLNESLGSHMSTSSLASSASFLSRQYNTASLVAQHSTGSCDAVAKPGTVRSNSRRRGFMRPQGTDFATSARQRESVLSLGPIAHLQYYFARTGLLDGKGAQLARKRQTKGYTLGLSSIDTGAYLLPTNDHDSTCMSMGSALDGGLLAESPSEEESEHSLDNDEDDNDEPDQSNMLPPTTSTYRCREHPLPKPPSIAELKADLTLALDAAAKALEAERKKPSTPRDQATPIAHVSTASQTERAEAPSWHEVQGMHILDHVTLAIRAAKMYFTAHEQPDRLGAIKSKKVLRSQLLSVMDVLKRMATRGFAGGMREDEARTMIGWIHGLRDTLAAEERVEAAERAERRSWSWLTYAMWAAARGAFAASDRKFAREEAFIRTMLAGASGPVEGIPLLPAWIPIDRSGAEQQELPTPYLAALANGLRLVQLHNCAVRKSRRRFGSIPSFHTDTQKPYRAADNLRYWVKAAELRWEIRLKIDPLGLQYNSSRDTWLDFEDAIAKWCRSVIEEIAEEVQS